MWYKIGSRKRYNNEALEIDIMKSFKNVFFLDAPSFCGKTYFLKHLNVGVIICPCRQFVEESLMPVMTGNIRREDMLKKLQTECYQHRENWRSSLHYWPKQIRLS